MTTRENVSDVLLALHPWLWFFGAVETQQCTRCTGSDENPAETGNITTEVWVSPVGWLPSCVGTLSRELRECAADTQVAGVAAAAAHVKHTGLDVMLRVDSLAARAPGLWTKKLVTRALLQAKSKRKTKRLRRCVLCKSNVRSTFSK